MAIYRFSGLDIIIFIFLFLFKYINERHATRLRLYKLTIYSTI